MNRSCEGVRTAGELPAVSQNMERRRCDNGKPAPAEKLGNELTPGKKAARTQTKGCSSTSCSRSTTISTTNAPRLRI